MEGLQPQNVLIMFLFSMKHWDLLSVETNQVINNYLNFTLYERTTVGNYLHVKSNFWCLIMASTKLMQYVYVTPLFCE